MKGWKIGIGLGIVAAGIGLALIGVGMARAGFARPDPGPIVGGTISPTVPGPGWAWGGWGMGPMMGGWGRGPFASGGLTGTVPFGGCPMLGGGWGARPGPSAGGSISDAEAVRIAQEAIAAYGNPDLELAEVMAFDNHFYAQARERSTGRYAFEFLIDPATGAVHPEPGPNMMWNARYGMMGGRFASEEMRISPEEARRQAQAYLDRWMAGAVVDETVDPFYGYYTMHILRDGRIVGMLSVHGSTGQVWVHTWHGGFLRMVYGHEEEHSP